jgi:hypothetical protein
MMAAVWIIQKPQKSIKSGINQCTQAAKKVTETKLLPVFCRQELAGKRKKKGTASSCPFFAVIYGFA